MGIVGAYQFDAILTCKFYQYLVGLLLQGEGLTVGTLAGIGDLVALKLEIVVVTPETLVPLDGLACPCDVTLQNLRRHLAGDAGRADNEVFMILLQFLMVCTGTIVETVYP
jgi:hypothetical protein